MLFCVELLLNDHDYFQAVRPGPDSDPQEEDTESKQTAKLGKLLYTLDYNFTDSAVWIQMSDPCNIHDNENLINALA